MAYAELAALRPRAGGEYVYLRAAYGRLAAFLTGLDVVRRRIFRRDGGQRRLPRRSTSNGSCPGVADATPFFVIPIPFVPLIFSRHTLVALSAVGCSCPGFTSAASARAGSSATCWPSLKVTALLLFIALGLSFGAGSTANFQQAAARTGGLTGGSLR